MKVTRIQKSTKTKKLVRCPLFEATHNMIGQEIVSLQRDSMGWISVGKEGELLSHMNLDGTAYSFEPSDIENNEPFYAAKYVEEKTEGEIQIVLTDSEAVILKKILGQYCSENCSKAFPILDTPEKCGNLYSKLGAIGIERDETLQVMTAGYSHSIPALCLREVN